MWSTPIDHYCERIDASFWSEPWNAWSNAAFFLAAVIAFAEWRRTDERDTPVLLLILMVAVIGIGSSLYHTFATAGTRLLDVIPISIFIYAYLLFALRRYLALGWLWAVAIVVAFAAFSLWIDQAVPRETINGSQGYLPALAALLAVGSAAADPRRRSLLFLAAGVFAVSVVLRSVDIAVCGAFPLGTHFAWHLLNGLVLYILLRAAMARPAVVRL